MFAEIDTTKLWAIIARLVCVDTVEDAQAFAVKVEEAKNILVEAGLRIAGLGSRDLADPQQAVKVATVVAAYYED
jgi:hypothetical protein